MELKDRIKELRKERGIQQKKLALALGVEQSTVSHWESGRQEPNTQQREKVAEYFGISVAELFGSPALKQAHDVQKIPVISWIHANQFEPIEDSFPPGTAEDWIYTDIKGKNMFALKIINDCMEPEFKEGSIIIVKPGIDVSSGDFVIVADRKSDKATFKQLKKYGDKAILHPLNPKYPDIELDHKKEYTIVGKVVFGGKKY